MSVTRVLLVNLKGRRDEGRKRMESLGLGYLASTLRREGHRVRTVDANFFGRAAGELRWDRLAAGRALIGFSVFHNNAAETLGVVRNLRVEGVGAHVTLGGHHATFNHRELLEDHPELDSVIRGEGEEALAELVGRLAAGADWRGTANLAYRDDDGRVRANPCRPRIENPSDLPWACRRNWRRHSISARTASVVSSRGCFGRCSFCSIHSIQALSPGRRWRPRDPGDVVEEMAMLVDELGVRHVNFADDNFFGPGPAGLRRAVAIADGILERGLRITFAVPTRPDNLDRATLLRLKEAGLICADIGAESFVPRQLALYDKRVTVDQNLRAVELLRQVGVEFRVYLVPFDPYVTFGELRQTAETCQRIGVRHLLDMCFFHRLRVYRGTPVADRLRADGLLALDPGRPVYEDHLPYRFLHPEMEEFFGLWHSAQPLYADLDRRVNQLFDLEGCNLLERSFALELKLALKQSALDLWRDSIRLGEDGRLAELPPMLRARSAALADDVAEIEAARAAGHFAEFMPRGYRLGGAELLFPARGMQALCRELLAGIPEGQW